MFTLAEVNEMEVIHQGQYDNLLADDGEIKIWLSRLAVEDGQPYNNQVTIEHLEDGRWVTIEEYEAR